QGRDRRFDRCGRWQIVPYPKNAIDEVEVELIYACKLAQFVLNQCLFGRAVHLLNTEAAEPGAGYAIYRCSPCGRALVSYVGVTADILGNRFRFEFVTAAPSHG